MLGFIIFNFILLLCNGYILLFFHLFILFLEFIGEPNVSAALRRAAGETLGYLCNAEGDAFTANLVRNITELVWGRREKGEGEREERKKRDLMAPSNLMVHPRSKSRAKM